MTSEQRVQSDNRPSIEGIILDLDGVLTSTAELHEQAWKSTFDEFLAKRARQNPGDASKPFRHSDYLRYVDGKPRHDGLRSFLGSRGIQLPEGQQDDPPAAETVYGLGSRKNLTFLNLLRQAEVRVYEDALDQVQAWKREGLPLAVVSSSRNAMAVLDAAQLSDYFEVQLDGHTAGELGLRGKPAADTFLHAAKLLGTAPEHTAVFEDASSGVRAGRKGGFARVIGVARDGNGQRLTDAGAHQVVARLTDAKLETGESQTEHAYALGQLDQIYGQLAASRGFAVFLDFDGTLAPIVNNPAEAQLPAAMRQVLCRLAERVPVAIVSGRDREDVSRRIGMPEVYYAGSHGFDISGPGQKMEHPAAVDALPALDEAENKLRSALDTIAGAIVERKRFGVAAHYRKVAEEAVIRVKNAVNTVHQQHPELRLRGGKKVFELQPNVQWDKGHAVTWLLDALQIDTDIVIPIYIGDDLTDEDAFCALQQCGGLTFRVGDTTDQTAADYRLESTKEVEDLLQHFVALAEARRMDRKANPDSLADSLARSRSEKRGLHRESGL